VSDSIALRANSSLAHPELVEGLCEGCAEIHAASLDTFPYGEHSG